MPVSNNRNKAAHSSFVNLSHLSIRSTRLMLYVMAHGKLAKYAWRARADDIRCFSYIFEFVSLACLLMSLSKLHEQVTCKCGKLLFECISWFHEKRRIRSSSRRCQLVVDADEEDDDVSPTPSGPVSVKCLGDMHIVHDMTKKNTDLKRVATELKKPILAFIRPYVSGLSKLTKPEALNLIKVCVEYEKCLHRSNDSEQASSAAKRQQVVAEEKGKGVESEMCG